MLHHIQNGVVRHTVDKKKTEFKKKNAPHWGWTSQFFRLRTLASLVSVNDIFRKLFCRHYVCIPFSERRNAELNYVYGALQHDWAEYIYIHYECLPEVIRIAKSNLVYFTYKIVP